LATVLATTGDEEEVTDNPEGVTVGAHLKGNQRSEILILLYRGIGSTLVIEIAVTGLWLSLGDP